MFAQYFTFNDESSFRLFKKKYGCFEKINIFIRNTQDRNTKCTRRELKYFTKLLRCDKNK